MASRAHHGAVSRESGLIAIDSRAFPVRMIVLITTQHHPYGKSRINNLIVPDSVLVFEMELIKVGV